MDVADDEDIEELENVENPEEEIEEEEKLSIYENLYYKNTPSFKCLQQIEISRSSLLRDPLYWFPNLEDPNLNYALWGVEEPVEYDDIGRERYRDLCKTEGIVPYKRVLKSLDKEVLDLKFYALSEKAMKTICETLQYNNYIRELILQENWLKPECVAHLGPMIEKNKSIMVLDLKQCQMGSFGVEQLGYSIALTCSIQELDLSNNNLGDEGVEILSESLINNTTIKILNLSHNNLGDRALFALRLVLEENYIIQDLDLSWNYLFNPNGMKELMEGLLENPSVKYLNLSWNGIGDLPTFRPILAYLRSGEIAKLQHLNLSHNRITGILVNMLKTGLRKNDNLITLNLASNPLKPSEVEFLANTFLQVRSSTELPPALTFIDFGEAWADKSFIDVQKRFRKKGCDAAIGGIFSNYTIEGPNMKEVLLKRATFVALNPKKKKFKKDIGEFIIMFKDEPILKEDFFNMIKKQKIKLDNDLIELMAKEFTDNRRVDLKDMKDTYLKLYPNTVPPVTKKKGKGKGKKNKKITEDVPEEQ